MTVDESTPSSPKVEGRNLAAASMLPFDSTQHHLPAMLKGHIQDGLTKKVAIEEQDFTAVILVGFGEHLYPFNEGKNKDVLSKALLPIGNIPIINIVLDWILASGLLEILLIVPPRDYSALSNHLAENYSSASYPRLNIILKKFTDGERDDDDISANGSGMKIKSDAEGTARLLKRFRSYIKSDFVLLPCDLYPPSYLSLISILDKHRSSNAAVLTSVLYDPPEAIRDQEEAILSAYDKHTHELLLLQNMDNLDEDFEIRSALLEAHPTLSLSTRLLDAHIYVCRRSILDLLASRRPRDLDSMKVQVIPWLVKGSWQHGLARQWSRILCPRGEDPLQKALALSTSALPATTALRGLSSSIAGSADPDEADESGMDASQVLPPKAIPTIPWHCQVIISRPPVPETPAPQKGKDKGKLVTPAEPEYLIRANTIVGYWELNRRFLRSLSSRAVVNPNRPKYDEGTQPPVHSSAQISPDSVVGESTKIGERASIKKTILGRHCVIGKGAKISGCILWDFVVVEEGAKLENSILCTNLRVGAGAQVKDCEFGPGYEVVPGAILKGERLVAGQAAER